MHNGVQVGITLDIAAPETFSPSTFKAGFVALTLCAKSIDALETKAAEVNGKVVIVLELSRATPHNKVKQAKIDATGIDNPQAGTQTSAGGSSNETAEKSV